MTDRDILEELQALFGGHIYDTIRQKPHHKQAWVWQIHGAKALSAMREMEPYLFGRRRAKLSEIYARVAQKTEKRNQKLRLYQTMVAEYRQGETSLRKCAKKYGVSVSTLQRLLK